MCVLKASNFFLSIYKYILRGILYWNIKSLDISDSLSLHYIVYRSQCLVSRWNCLAEMVFLEVRRIGAQKVLFLIYEQNFNETCHWTPTTKQLINLYFYCYIEEKTEFVNRLFRMKGIRELFSKNLTKKKNWWAHAK